MDNNGRPTHPKGSVEEQFCRIEKKYNKAYRCLNEALTCDEQKRTGEAIELYVQGISYMNSAMTTWKTLCQAHPNEMRTSRMAPKMEKMASSLEKTHNRVQVLLAANGGSHSRGSSRAPPEAPPSYNATLAQKNLSSQRSLEGAASAMTDASLLFYVETGVQIYFISNDGSVSAPSYPSALSVYGFLDGATCSATADSPPAFLQVGDWIYPLMPGISPALHADWGAYVFPDVTARDPGCYVGVIIPDTVDAAKRQKLEDILHEYTSFKEQVPGEQAVAAPPSDASSTISKGIHTAAEWISWGLTKGAEKGGQLVKYGSEKLREHMEPQSEASKIDPRVQKGAHYARVATGGAVKISGHVVDKVGEAAAALARTVAPYVRRTSESLMPESWSRKDSTSGKSTLDKISEVATSSLQGFSTVFLGMEQSAMILAKSISSQTVQTVHFKYGKDAGELTENVVHSATNAVVVTSTFNRLGAQVVARQVAKETAAQSLRQQETGQPPSGKTGPPNGEKKKPPHSDKTEPSSGDKKGSSHRDKHGSSHPDKREGSSK